jgi:hypothetical protein
MTSVADYFKNIPGEKSPRAPQKAIRDDNPAYVLGSRDSASKINLEKAKNKIAEFVASKNRSKFHRRDCEWAVYILNSQNLVTFSSYQDATQAGYKPCRTCINVGESKQKNPEG